MDAGEQVRAARVAAGLSQEALARAAGSSRALVSAIERGRHRPGVDVAIALAGALGRSVEALFGAVDGSTPAVASTAVGDRAADGELVRTARVRAVGVHVRADPADPLALAAADAVLDAAGHPHPLGPASEPASGVVVAGCDPALAIAAALGPRHGAGRVVDVATTSDEARALVRAGRVHAALVHGVRPRPRAGERHLRRVRIGGWRVGVAATPRGPRELADVLAGGGPFVRRAASASAQQAVERAARVLGLALPAGPVAPGHLAAVRHAVLAGGAAVANEPAARAAGLRFLPVETHEVELWIAPDAEAGPGVRELLRLLASERLRARLPGRDAYDLAAPGAAPATS